MDDKDKSPIGATVERKGGAVIEVFKDFCIDNFDAFLYFITGRFVHTNDYRVCNHLDYERGIIHESINHSNRRYKECYKHTNTVEDISTT